MLRCRLDGKGGNQISICRKTIMAMWASQPAANPWSCPRHCRQTPAVVRDGSIAPTQIRFRKPKACPVKRRPLRAAGSRVTPRINRRRWRAPLWGQRRWFLLSLPVVSYSDSDGRPYDARPSDRRRAWVSSGSEGGNFNARNVALGTWNFAALPATTKSIARCAFTKMGR